MSDDDEQYLEEKFLHRKSCSHRIFIGPWDIEAPIVYLTEQEQFPNEHHNDTANASSISLPDSGVKILVADNASTQPIPRMKSNTVSNNSNKSAPTTTTNRFSVSSGTSFVTARTGTSSTSAYQSADSRPHFLEDLVKNEDEDEEIDYSFLTGSLQPTNNDEEEHNSYQSDTESIQTVRPSTSQQPATAEKKGKQPMNTNVNHKKNKKFRHFNRRGHNKKQKSLLWKRAGSVFVSRQVPTVVTPNFEIIPTNQPIKKEPMLCMRSVTSLDSVEPSRYKAAKEARYDLLTEKWSQVQLVLTTSYIATYSSSTYFWPKQRLGHRIFIQGNRKQRRLELFLLSPLDYTFCLRYQHHDVKSSREPTLVTFTFKARSFLKCQEWYMQLYDMLPRDAKPPRPDWCEVYIPLLDLTVNLPLQNIKNNAMITMTDVKDTVIAVLEEGGEELTDRLIESHKELKENCCIEDFGLCWTSHGRAEWIYWRHSSSDPNIRIDRVICPQNIENTHRLELRLIQHTPHDIVLPDVTLKEPPPVEGFLTHVSDFFGSLIVKQQQRKTGYFASFDHYLFYIPPNKVTAPDTACFIDELHCNSKSQPFVAAISPYTNNVAVELKENERRMKLMREAKGLVDLTDVSYVRRTFASSPEMDESHISEYSQMNLIKNEHRQKPCLELIMENGVQIKLEAYSSETCDLWVNYLSQLIVYWKARKEAVKVAHHSYYDCQEEKANGRKKNEELADTRIWSYCLYEQCRDVVKSGILYYKPHKRGSYSQKIFILTCNGWLLYYDIYNRTHFKKKSSNHEKKGALDIAGCYFYSGVDSSKQHKGTSTNDALFKNAARIYKNGSCTDDDTLSCIFSIWKPKLRKYFSPQRQRLRVYQKDERLNPSGSTWTFLAPSRREKEEWVCALNTVTEHLIRNETR